MKSFAVVISGLLLSAPANAQSPREGVERPAAEQPSGNSATEADGEERRICRRVETNTGSRVPFRRLCLTEAQWEAYRRQN